MKQRGSSKVTFADESYKPIETKLYLETEHMEPMESVTTYADNKAVTIVMEEKTIKPKEEKRVHKRHASWGGGCESVYSTSQRDIYFNFDLKFPRRCSGLEDRLETYSRSRSLDDSDLERCGSEFTETTSPDEVETSSFEVPACQWRAVINDSHYHSYSKEDIICMWGEAEEKLTSKLVTLLEENQQLNKKLTAMNSTHKPP